MAGPAKEDAGEIVACPSCGKDVKQKAMIPIMPETPGSALRYLCTECAQALVPA